MKKLAIILACLTTALGSSLYAQSAGGGAGGAGGTGGAGGAAGGAGASGATGGTVRPSGAATTTPATPDTRAGTGPSQRIYAPPGGIPRSPLNPALPGALPGQGTPGTPGTVAPGTAQSPTTSVPPAPRAVLPPGATTGSTGGVGPGTGGTGGNLPGTTQNPLDSGVSATTGVQPGAAGTTPGVPGSVATPGVIPNTPASLQTGVTTQPGVGIGETGTGSASDMIFAQRVRGQLLNSLSVNQGARAQTGLRGLTPQSLANVQINAYNGTVTLLGSVNSEAERRLLETNIRSMGGVQRIVNNLVVVPQRNQTGLGTPGRVGTGAGVGSGNSIPSSQGVDQGLNPNPR